MPSGSAWTIRTPLTPGLDDDEPLDRYLRPVVQHYVNDFRIDEYVLDQLIAQQINHQTHEGLSAGYARTKRRPIGVPETFLPVLRISLI